MPKSSLQSFEIDYQQLPLDQRPHGFTVGSVPDFFLFFPAQVFSVVDFIVARMA